MKKQRYHIIIILAIPFLLIKCGVGDGETTLNVSFTNHPSSGTNVNELEANFRVERNFEDNSNIFQESDEPDDIRMTVEWWWMAGDRSETDQMSSRNITIDSDSERLQSSLSAGSGRILLNYWYLKILWEDDDGFHEIESREAFLDYSGKQHEDKKEVELQ